MLFVLIVLLCTVLLLLLTVSYVRMLHACRRKAKISTTVSSAGSTSADTVSEYAQAPGPTPWPILGNLALLGRYKVPFEGFTQLSTQFGDAYSLTLGTTRCLIVNNLELIREVLNQNGKFFGGRPDFLRYHKLFGGDRNNSLALCDWSHLQQKRRNLARRHCSPRDSSSYFSKMSSVGCLEVSQLIDQMHERIVLGEAFAIKPLIQQACANMFSQYMCSVRFDYADTEFQKIVEYFDEIFWEINQGYAVDFLPFLAPLYKRHVNRIVHWSTTIRKFILDRVIDDRERQLDVDEPERDFTDALLKSLAENEEVTRDTIIFMLEDFIGGHSAVGNLVMLALAYVAKHPHIGVRIQQEADRITHNQRNITLYDMNSMPYTLATIFEVLRYSSSPIVPHVATEDAVISGHGVTAGTIVFINNYKLNTSEQYWTKPKIFDPERFLEKIPSTPKQGSSTKVSEAKRRNSEGSDSGVEFEKDATVRNSFSNGSFLNAENIDVKQSELHNDQNQKRHEHEDQVRYQVKKNIPHFLPFSIGKRTCIGQNLVRGFGFILLANILQRYDVSSKDLSTININPACVALPAHTFPLVFSTRSTMY